MTDLLEAAESVVADGRRAPHAATLLWVLPIAGAVLAPGLYQQLVMRVHAFRLAQFVDTTAIVSVIAVLTLVAVHLGGGRVLRRSLAVTAVTILCLFMWPLFTAVGNLAATTSGVDVVGDAVAVLSAAALLWLAARIGADPLFPAVVGGAALAVVVAMVLLMSGRFVSPVAVAADPVLTAGPGSFPSVVVVVLDEYGRGDILSEVYGFDNAAFLQGLEARGFVVADAATSNYNHTFASVSSMLDLSYPFATGALSDEAWSDTRVRLSGSNALFDAFHAHGYDIVSFENAWGGSNCTSAVEQCIRDGLFATDLWRLATMSVFRPLVSAVAPTPFQRQGLEQLRALGDVVTGPWPGERRLTFAHITLPHAPLTLRGDCSVALGGARASALVAGEAPDVVSAKSAALAGQLGCVNATMLDELDQILEADPGTIVVITGDHGPEPFLIDLSVPPESQAAAIDARYGILLAARLPASCSSESFRSPVNAIRIAVDCALGTDLGTLGDRWFLTPAEGLEGDVVEVTTPVPAELP